MVGSRSRVQFKMPVLIKKGKILSFSNYLLPFHHYCTVLTGLFPKTKQ